jgi:AcrR family transcriptional regulator
VPRQRRPAAQTREHVLAVANDLFYWQGIRATGIDALAEAAGVAPTTLYRLFPSKDDLVAAYVERAGHNCREWFDKTVEAAGPDPRARILALFDGLEEQVRPENCRGCPFLMALTELPDTSLGAHKHAVATKAWVRKRFGELARDLHVDDPETLADQLTLVFEGVYASVQALGADGPAARARAFAERILPGK